MSDKTSTGGQTVTIDIKTLMKQNTLQETH